MNADHSGEVSTLKKFFDQNNPAAYWILWGLAKKLSQRLRETDQRLKAILALIRRF